MFSVVIPLYNKEKYILRAVESVLSQSYKKFELIVVDDGSTDNSLKSLKGILDPRVRVISQTNQGVGAARNKGMTEAKYEWIAFLDADDAWSTTHLSELLNIIAKFPNSGMVSTKILEVEDSNKPSIFDANIQANIRSINYFYEAAQSIGIVNSSSVAVSKKSFNNIGGFSKEKAGEDLEFWARIACFYPVAISDNITAYYFRDTDGVMSSQFKNKLKSPLSLNDISPSVSLLIKESIKNSSILKDKNIKKYINSRLFNGVKGAIFRRDFPVAKSYAKLALPQFNFICLFLLLFRITPNVVLAKIISLYFFVRTKI